MIIINITGINFIVKLLVPVNFVCVRNSAL